MTRDEALSELRRLCPPGTIVRTILRHVSRSGMTRRISAVLVNGSETRDLDWLIDKAGIFREGKGGGLVLSGCGMDMGFHLVYTLGSRLYPKGTETPHGTRNGVPDSDGGYALKHRWI